MKRGISEERTCFSRISKYKYEEAFYRLLIAFIYSHINVSNDGHMHFDTITYMNSNEH